MKNSYQQVNFLFLYFQQNNESLSYKLSIQENTVIITAPAFNMPLLFSGESLSVGSSNRPPLALLRVVASWVSENPELCIMTCPSNLLTVGSLRGSVAPPESTSLPIGPVLGLLRWVVLMPLHLNGFTSNLHVYKDSRVLCSQLHLAIIQAFLLAGKDKEDPQDEMELEPGEVMDESDSQHLIKGTDLKELSQDMKKLIDKLATVEFSHSIIAQQVQLSMDRFAQILQVAMATGCLSAAKGWYPLLPV